MISRLFFCLFATVLLVLSAPATAASSEHLQKAETAVDVLDDIVRIPENSIPIKLLKRAYAIAVFPGVVKAGLIVGGQAGEGMISVRHADGTWSLPVFTKLRGGSLGFQAGVQSTDVVLLFMNKRSVNDIINGTFTLGGDASVAAGPVGRTAEASTSARLDAEIYSYSRARGLFAGLSITGSKLGIDYEANEAVYSREATPRRVFAGDVGERSQAVVAFTNRLEEISALALPESD